MQDTIEWYNQNADKYASAVQDYVSLDEIDHFKSLLFDGAKVLDLGCGSGRDSKILAEKGLKVEGIDLSEGLLEIARKNNPNLEFTHANMLDLPLEPNTYDGVWAHASLVHLETESDTAKAISEIHRVLKADGLVHILVKAQSGNEKTAVVTDKLSGHDRFFQYYTMDEIRKLLTNTGFEVIELEKYRETDKNPNGRPEVEWIRAYAKKQ